jgi:multicomponent Na+:H+ antiporter subunit A
MVGSLYLLFAGHNQPGGGFAGGIVAGAAVALRYVAGGIDDVRSLSRARPWTVLGAGLLLAALTATVPLLFGGAVLESALVEGDLPLLGHVKVGSALAFDVGVYLVVLGLVLMVFESFGDDPRVPAP